MGKKPGYAQVLKMWSRDFGWVAKAREYDQEQFKQRRKKHQARIDQMNEDHFTLARAQGLRAVKLIDKRIEDGKIIDVALVQYIKAMVDLQRLAAGAATDQL